MRKYPLLKKSGIIPTEENWQHTYVDFLAFQSKSLVDYSNYFLTDYRRGPDFIRITEEGEPVTIIDSGVEYDHCYSIENLKFHQFRDTETEVAVYFLKVSDYYEYCQTHSKNYKIIRSGRHIINNNQMADHTDIDMI